LSGNRTCIPSNPKYNIKSLIGNTYRKLARGNIFKSTIGNQSFHEASNDNGVRTVHLPLKRSVKSKIIPTCNVRKFSWISLMK
jgi:hypothetical protein